MKICNLIRLRKLKKFILYIQNYTSLKRCCSKFFCVFGFFDVIKFLNARLPSAFRIAESNGVDILSRIKRNSGTRFGNLFILSQVVDISLKKNLSKYLLKSKFHSLYRLLIRYYANSENYVD